MAVIKYEKNGQYFTLPVGGSEKTVTYDVSATDADKVKLSVISIGDGTHLAKLTGYGATKDFGKDEVKPWDKYIPSISAIEIGAGVTSIGDNLFRRHEAVKSLVFEDSGCIRHFGDKAFQGCQFSGEYSFPNLKDTALLGTFAHCTKLRGLTLNGVKNIGATALTGCLSLEYVRGLGSVETVATAAFLYTPKLYSLDIDPAVCTSFSESAFLLSGIMRYASPTVWSKVQMGADAIPAMSYTDATLANIRAVGLPNVTPNEVNADASYRYTDIPYCKRGDTQLTIGSDGCMALALYHMFNWTKGAPYADFREWWENEIISKNPQITETDINEVQAEMANTLGWTVRNGFPIKTKANPDAAKRAIASELSAGRALVANLAYYYGGGHSVAIIGSNAVTDKLIVADGTRTSGERGCTYEVSFEQFFGSFDNAMVIAYETGGDG